ncbi:MAG: FtsX-like permease family protein, partial [Bryobacteraceae bacterium]
VLLALAGGALGLPLAMAWIRVLRATIRIPLPPWMQADVDGGVLLFLLVISAAAGVASGLAPALRLWRPDLSVALREGARGSTDSGRLRASLVVAEVSLAVVVLIGAALMVRSFLLLESAGMGFDSRNLLTLRVVLPFQTHGGGRSVEFYRRVLEELGRLPGVESAFLNTNPPLAGGPKPAVPVGIEGQTPSEYVKNPAVTFQRVSAGYHRGMSVPLVRGRGFDERDREGAPPVAIVGERLASRLWPGEDAIGKRIRAWPTTPVHPWMEVVGVAGSVKQESPAADDAFDLYASAPQSPTLSAYFLLRTKGDPASMARPAARAVSRVDPQHPAFDVATMDQRIRDSIWQRRASGSLFAAFGALALGLAAVGIYGVISYGVSRRTREIGLRLALGAQPADVQRMVIAEGLRLTALGAAMGVGLALAGARAMASLLYGVSATDGLSLALAPLLLGAVAAVACYIPARRAMRVDPVVALREE